MAWTPKQKKAHSARMKAKWAEKKQLEGSAVYDHSNCTEGHCEHANIDAHSSGAKFDMVNHPAHYTFSKYEVADVSDAWFPTEPLLWNANKYTARWDKKGDPIENLEKAVWYIQRRINQLKEVK